MERKEKTSLIEMLNTSIGNISGLFKKKEKEKEIELEEIATSHDKSSESFLLDEEEEFEKDLSRISVSVEEKRDSTTEEPEKRVVPVENESLDEIYKLKKIISLKDEIRQREREKENESAELRILQSIKTQAELDYEKKRVKILLQMIESLEKRLEESEIQCLELMKYCNLLIEQQENRTEKEKESE